MQGIGLRGHRDDGSCESSNMGNYKVLIKMRVDAGDKLLENHLNNFQKMPHMSKTTQNELLLCIKQFILDEVKSQAWFLLWNSM